MDAAVELPPVDAANDDGRLDANEIDALSPHEAGVAMDAGADAGSTTDSEISDDPAESPPPPLSIQIDYQARCIDCDSGTPDYPERRIHVTEGEGAGDIAIECSVLQYNQNERSAYFSLSYTDAEQSGSSFSLQAGFDLYTGGVEAGQSFCSVYFTEGEHRYGGFCVEGFPERCELEAELDGHVLTGSLWCDGITGDGVGHGYLASPMSEEPAAFEIHGCAVPDLTTLGAQGTGGGTLDWARGIGPSETSYKEIATLPDGSIWVTGDLRDETSFGLNEAGMPVLIGEIGLTFTPFIARYEADGALAWARQLAVTNREVGWAMSRSIAAAGDASVVVAGEFGGTVTFAMGESQQTTISGSGTFLARYNSNGSLAWVKRLGGVGTDVTSDGLADGSAIVAGTFSTTLTLAEGEPEEISLASTGANDVFVARYNASGTLVWATRAGGVGDGRSTEISVLADGSAFITGNFTGSATFGAGEAHATTLISAGDPGDLFLARYDADGTLAWAKRAGGNDWDIGFSVSTLPDGSSLVTGGFGGSAIFGAGETHETTLTSAGTNEVDPPDEIFVAKYNPSGTLIWAKHAGWTSCCLVGGSNYLSNGRDVAVLPNGAALITGTFQGYATFGQDEPNETTLHGSGGGLFVARYESDGTLSWARQAPFRSSGMPSIAALPNGSAVIAGDFQPYTLFGSDEAHEPMFGAFYVARFDP